VLWLDTLASLPFLARWSAADIAELRRLASLFLDEKEFSGAGGLTVTDAMAVRIAVQACLPVLRIGLQPYRGFVGIVVHPDEVVAPREVVDDDGIVHEYDEVLTGEAMGGGPLMLSWTDVRDAGESADWAYNVVIHEFAHQLDQETGAANGAPFLGRRDRYARWAAVLSAEFAQLRERVARGEHGLIDAYGANDPAEFFAVVSEAYFGRSTELAAEHPALHRELRAYYGTNPLSW